jgi:hypothetical protein
MPDGVFAKTPAEVALDLVNSYLEFAGEEEKEKFRDVDAYLGLYEKAFRLIVEISDKPKQGTGFQP